MSNEKDKAAEKPEEETQEEATAPQTADKQQAPAPPETKEIPLSDKDKQGIQMLTNADNGIKAACYQVVMGFLKIMRDQTSLEAHKQSLAKTIQEKHEIDEGTPWQIDIEKSVIVINPKPMGMAPR